MKNSIKISEAEWEIMKIIWRKAPVTSDEIIEDLSSKKDWSSKTVKSFLNRLLNKQVIDYEKSGRNYLYHPLVSEDECIEAESRSFLDRVYNGAVDLMFSHYLKSEKLTDEEIESLQKLLLESKREK